MTVGERVSASTWNEFCELVEAWVSEQSPRRIVDKFVASAREELAFGFYAEITEKVPNRLDPDSRYAFRSVRWNNAGLVEADPSFRGDGVSVYAVEMTNQEVEVGSVQFLVPGSRAPYEFVKANVEIEPSPPSEECQFTLVTCVGVNAQGQLIVERTTFRRSDCAVLAVECLEDPEECCNVPPPPPNECAECFCEEGIGYQLSVFGLGGVVGSNQVVDMTCATGGGALVGVGYTIRCSGVNCSPSGILLTVQSGFNTYGPVCAESFECSDGGAMTITFGQLLAPTFPPNGIYFNSAVLTVAP
jgi:hypothetical protein